MQLAMWTYEGPPHVGAMRVATAMRGVHYVLHAPQGDTYADLLFTMIERRDRRPPVTYTTFQARDLGGDTAEKLKSAIAGAYDRFKPDCMLVGASCTAELIQDDPGGLALAVGLPIPVVALELPSYQKKENWGAAETFYRIVRTLAAPAAPGASTDDKGATSKSPSPQSNSGVPELDHQKWSKSETSDFDAGEGKAEGSPPGVALASGVERRPAATPHPTVGYADGHVLPQGKKGRRRPSCNILGPAALGFRHRDDLAEIRGLLSRLGVDVNVVAPLDASPADIARLGDADFNVVLYPEIAAPAAAWLKKTYRQPSTTVVPIGVGATREFIAEVAILAGIDAGPLLAAETSRLPWYSRSVDSSYLTGKRVFIFGDATHVIAAARIASKELGFKVAGLGTFTREFAREVRAVAAELCVEALITDDHMEVEAAISALQVELVLGTQMERHIAKRLGVPCAVISAPVHVQDFPARTSPQMGFEGANVIFDAWVHPLMMGLEEHLLAMFRDDFEFADGAAPSHLGPEAAPEAVETIVAPASSQDIVWVEEAERELKKIPFFVRGKARRNTETYARNAGIAAITVETLYDAKAHFGR